MMDSFEYAPLSSNTPPLTSSCLVPVWPFPPPWQIPARGPLPPPSTRQIPSTCSTRSYTPPSSARLWVSPRPLSRVCPLTFLLRVSAPTLLAAGSTSQTCTSCLLISRPPTSSLCRSSPKSRRTTLWETRFMTWRPRFSVSPSHVHYPRGHIHARRVLVYPPWTASRIQQRPLSVWRAHPVRRTY